MKTNLKWIAICLSALMLMQSCAVYQGNYSLDSVLENRKKVKVKLRYNEYILFSGYRYKYKRIDDYNTWNISQDKNLLAKDYELLASKKVRFADILHFEGSYYGLNDFSDPDTWEQLDQSAITEVPKTKRHYFKRIIHQQGKYYGVQNDNVDLVNIEMNLEPIYPEQVDKVSLYDPVLSVLGTIIAAPLIMTVLLLTSDDEW
jgi:hypothetical protein